MSTLFTISVAWNDSVYLYEQLGFASQGDAILLLQDGVLAVHSNINLASFVAKCEAMSIRLYVLKDDCELRGIENKYNDIESIDYVGFVTLVSEHEKQVAW